MSKLHEYLTDKAGEYTPLKRQIYEWKQKEKYEVNIPELIYGFVPIELKRHIEKKPLLSKAEMRELLENDVLPVFVMSHASFPVKNNIYSIFGNPSRYSYIIDTDDIEMTVPEDAILVNMDINNSSMTCNLVNDIVIMRTYGTHPDLLVGTDRHSVFDADRYDIPTDHKHFGVINNIYNHSLYYFEGDPFYNLLLSFGDDNPQTFITHYLLEAPYSNPDFDKFVNYWGLYIPTGDYNYKKIPCHELLMPFIGIDLTKPFHTFEMITEDDTLKIVQESMYDLKIHMVCHASILELIYKIFTHPDKTFRQHINELYDYEHEDFDDLLKLVYEKHIEPYIYNATIYKDGEKAYPSNVEEQEHDIFVVWMSLCYKSLEKVERDAAYPILNETLKLILEYPVVFEFYGPRQLMEDTNLYNVEAMTLRDMVEYMTPRLKRGEYGVPIKKKILYYLISCRENFVPSTKWGDKMRDIAMKQHEIRQVGISNTLPYKQKQTVMTRKSRRSMFPIGAEGEDERLLEIIKRNKTRKGGRIRR
jgi:hypothetical protein